MAVCVGVGAGNRAAPVHKGGDLCRGSVAESGPLRPDNLVPFVREILVLEPHRSARDDAAGYGVCVACDRCSFRNLRHVNNRSHVGYVGHHAIDARSVLGTVQGSSLRSARACARPAGLDGACAQIAFWLLRDGRERVLWARNTLSQFARQGIGPAAGCRRTETQSADRSDLRTRDTASCVRYSGRRTCCRNLAACSRTTELTAVRNNGEGRPRRRA